MNRNYGVSFYADPFTNSELRFGLTDIDSRSLVLASYSDLLTTGGNLFTFQASRLIEALRIRQLSPPENLVDIQLAMQLVSGQPRREFERSEWRPAKWLALTDFSKPDRDLYFGLIEGEREAPDSETLQRLLLKASTAMADVWTGISAELERIGELKRFLTFEVPVQQIMYRRQMNGIAVDLSVSRQLLESAKSEKYEAMLKVGAALLHNPTGLTYSKVLPLVHRTDAANVASFENYRNLPSYFKMAANSSTFARDFRTMIQANRNIKYLLAFAASPGRVYPAFDAMGTVTARILASSPNVQQLRKSYRCALTADPKRKSSYLDYSQYEPGVLAELVGPGPFRDLYNSGDIYAALSEAVFGNRKKRDLSKQIFIAFCYGMELESIGQLLDGSDKADGQSGYAALVGSFFCQFPELMDFRKRCEFELERSGYIQTVLGNRRIRKRRGALSRRERGWAMNQVVQGTASLIFKDVLLSLSRVFGPDSILLPIHDAVWLQAPDETMSVAQLESDAIAEMTSVFKRWCPNVLVRIKSSQFGEAES